MTNRVSPPVTGSAAMHAERIRAAEQQRAAEPGTVPAGQSTAERYAQRILPGYRADEALREGARMRELVARGVITPEPDIEEVDEDAEEFEEEVDEEEPEDEQPPTTAELYARRERARQQAGRAATLAAHRASTQVTVDQATRPVVF